jgi:hypothetical protein
MAMGLLGWDADLVAVDLPHEAVIGLRHEADGPGDHKSCAGIGE